MSSRRVSFVSDEASARQLGAQLRKGGSCRVAEALGSSGSTILWCTMARLSCASPGPDQLRRVMKGPFLVESRVKKDLGSLTQDGVDGLSSSEQMHV